MPDFSGTYVATAGVQTLVAAPGGHQIALLVATGQQKTSDENWSGAKLTLWGTTDVNVTEGTGTSRGYFRNEHADGDIDYGTTEATVSTSGTAVTLTGTWRFTGGTGKFANVSGNGQFTDKQTSPNSSEGSWSGTYNLG